MRLLLWTLSSALLFASGCTQDTGSGTYGLIHEGATASHSLVLAEGFEAPTLESALPAGAIATPIEIEVEGELAIAWRRYDEVPEQRSESDVVALWRVVDRTPVASTESSAPVAVSGLDLGLSDVDFDYLHVDLGNRMELGPEFDPELWELWQFFVVNHAICP